MDGHADGAIFNLNASGVEHFTESVAVSAAMELPSSAGHC